MKSLFQIDNNLCVPFTIHGGNIHAISKKYSIKPESIIDFSANINPLGPVSTLIESIKPSLFDILHYPDPEYTNLTTAISGFGNWKRSQILAGNGASELLYAAANINGLKRAVIPLPSYSDYTTAVLRAMLPVKHINCKECLNFSIDIKELSDTICPNDLIIIGRPNNPTGTIISSGEIQSLATRHCDALFVIDESFLEFTSHSSIADTLPDNVIMIRSMTKFYAIPGLRLGYAIAKPDLIKSMKEHCIPWSINCVAEKAGIASLGNKTFTKESRDGIQKIGFTFFSLLRDFSELKVYPSECNFFLIQLNNGYCGSDLFEKLINYKIAIRTCCNFPGLDDTYIRIAVRSVQDNQLFIDALRQIFRNHPNAS